MPVLRRPVEPADHSGQKLVRARNSLSAYDPKRTLATRAYKNDRYAQKPYDLKLV